VWKEPLRRENRLAQGPPGPFERFRATMWHNPSSRVAVTAISRPGSAEQRISVHFMHFRRF